MWLAPLAYCKCAKLAPCDSWPALYNSRPAPYESRPAPYSSRPAPCVVWLVPFQGQRHTQGG
ncbi:hypothetical protein L195_g061947 [Trifolium pratense]|uniref:Uncharacterized protein n=1 Tax=Trifolium pratense TaxID=57577 RepID=A0A2K3KCW4_TRIPR|nr:hypothetical protein L195_g061947 [Trifolium pratense]